MRRLLAIAAAVAATAAWLSTATARADGPPGIDSLDPSTLLLTKGTTVLIHGHDLRQVTSVVFSPALQVSGFVALDDGTIRVTLPGNATPGEYAVHLLGVSGSSDAIDPPILTLTNVPATPPPPPLVLPDYHPLQAETTPAATAAPAAVGQAQTGVVGTERPRHRAGAAPGHAASAPFTLSPFVVLMAALGLTLIGVGYAFWAAPGELAVARNQSFWLHLRGRPLVILGLGRVCRRCHRFYTISGTRRDLWRNTTLCSPKCFKAEVDGVTEGHHPVPADTSCLVPQEIDVSQFTEVAGNGERTLEEAVLRR